MYKYKIRRQDSHLISQVTNNNTPALVAQALSGDDQRQIHKYTNTQEYKHVNSEIQSNYPSHGRGQLRWQSIADCCIRPKRQTNTMKPISKYISQLFIWCLHICNSWIQTLLDIVNLCCIIYGPMKICNVMSIYGGKTSQPNLAILKNRAMCMGGKRMEYFPTKIEPHLFFLFSSIFLLLLE